MGPLARAAAVRRRAPLRWESLVFVTTCLAAALLGRMHGTDVFDFSNDEDALHMATSRRVLTIHILIACIATIVLLSGRVAAQGPPTKASKYADPTRFEKAIEAFESRDARHAPPNDAVLCTGSSTMLMWHAKIHEDLAPLTIVARGFGGSTMHDLLYFADRIVIPYRPRAIVVYEGDNDVAQGVGAQEIRDTFNAFVRKVHGKLPKTRIYFLAIKPSHRRWEMWPVMQKANRLIAHECVKDERLTYVDIAAALLDKEGNVRRELFRDDDLHLNRAGYEKVRGVLRPLLIKQELAREKK